MRTSVEREPQPTLHRDRAFRVSASFADHDRARHAIQPVREDRKGGGSDQKRTEDGGLPLPHQSRERTQPTEATTSLEANHFGPGRRDLIAQEITLGVSADDHLSAPSNELANHHRDLALCATLAEVVNEDEDRVILHAGTHEIVSSILHPLIMPRAQHQYRPQLGGPIGTPLEMITPH